MQERLPARVHRLRGDDGASLILVLVFLTVSALLTTALLGLSSTSLLVTKRLNEQAATVYAGDGATQAAIEKIRNSTYNNDPSGPGCPDTAFPATDGSGPALVTCQAGPGSGAAASGVPVTASNRPGQAILTLGTGAGGEDGLTQASNNVLRVKGKVFSTSSVNVPVSGASLDVQNAQLQARSCIGNGTITSSPAPNCASTAAPPDPNYAQPAGPLVWRPVPACNPGGVVRFEPGFYDNAAAMSSLMTTCTAVFWFPPASGGGAATYYFDFANNDGLWTMSNANAVLVGGQPAGWSSSSDVASVRAKVPGACVSPLTTVSNDGVQFVFGGNSRLQITAGRAEICGQYYPSKPPVAVYGAKSAIPAVTTGPNTYVMTAGSGTSNPATGAGAFTGLDNAAARDGVTATAANLPARSTSTATLRGFAPNGGIDSGAYLVSAALKVTHREADASGGSSGKVTATSVSLTPQRSGAASTGSLSVPLNVSTALATASIDITAQLATEFKTYGWSGAAVSFAASTNNQSGASAYLDSVELQLTWQSPSLRAESGCVTATPYTAGGSTSASCALIYTDGSQTQLYIQGTTYTPLAALDIRLTNSSAQVFRAGVISRALHMKITASAGYSGPVIEVPDFSSGPTNLSVYFTTYVCPQAAGTCTTSTPGSVIRLRAKVTYDDNGSAPVPGQRGVKVDAWRVER